MMLQVHVSTPSSVVQSVHEEEGGKECVTIAIYFPVDISTTVFSYSRTVQYHTILHGVGVIAWALGLYAVS